MNPRPPRKYPRTLFSNVVGDDSLEVVDVPVLRNSPEGAGLREELHLAVLLRENSANLDVRRREVAEIGCCGKVKSSIAPQIYSGDSHSQERCRRQGDQENGFFFHNKPS